MNIQNGIIKLGESGSLWTLPASPMSMDDVLFVKERPENQFWKRDNSFPKIFFDYHIFAQLNADKTEYNQDGVLISLNAKDTVIIHRLVTREMKRRWEGVWFMNNGVLTYMTGSHYFMLQWGAMPDFRNKWDDSHYGYYREFQGELHYFLQMCKEDPDTGGGDIGKAKKTGVTQLLALDYLDESTKYKQKRFGMMSKSQDDCKRTNFMYYMYGLQELPLVFKPSIMHETQTLIRFDNPKKKSTGTRNSTILNMQLSAGFNSEVFAAPTVRAAFDGPKMFRGWLDEYPKYEDPYPGEVFEATSETVKMGSRIDGKIWLSAYSPEIDGRSFDEASKTWYDSIEVNKYTNRTSSGLKAYFISVLDSGEENFDKHGICDRRKTQVWVEATREQKKNDTKGLQAFTRQYPIYADEMWQVGGGGGSTFDNIRIGQQKSNVEFEAKTHLPFEPCRLEWEGQPLLSTVLIVPLRDEEILRGTEGPWRFYGRKYLDPTTLNLPLRMLENGLNNNLQPVKFSPYASAWDPADYVQANDVQEGSKNACMIESDPDIVRDSLHGTKVSDQLEAIYFHRFNNPEDDLMEIVKSLFLFGGQIYVETNKPWAATRLKGLGLAEFLIVREVGRGLVPYNEHRHQKLPATTADVIEDYIKAIMVRLSAPKEGTGGIDHLKYLKDERHLKQLMRFNPLDTKKYDLAVCYGLLRLFKNARAAMRLLEELRSQKGEDTGMASALRYLINPLI